MRDVDLSDRELKKSDDGPDGSLCNGRPTDGTAEGSAVAAQRLPARQPLQAAGRQTQLRGVHPPSVPPARPRNPQNRHRAHRVQAQTGPETARATEVPRSHWHPLDLRTPALWPQFELTAMDLHSRLAGKHTPASQPKHFRIA
ncbi:hypothetical protein SeMB42_g03535 [Synchytrium endobioticum]|uniref:Uncharacterized protein n=1 Tax=Synchytrium endobioticum TaxID=286115 RepID=A0A507DJ30_9FUNG|nr:hypothetical protein SeMB42_g03535 [Synchytrium endobioticum]TPX51265.1 hypothetical protein SeLEV6574_g00368 [Synchytrium endobioticum]